MNWSSKCRDSLAILHVRLAERVAKIDVATISEITMTVAVTAILVATIVIQNGSCGK